MADPDRRGARVTPQLSPGAPMRDFQRYVAELEAYHGWERVSLVETCFLMGEEVGELFKAVRRVRRLFEQVSEPDGAAIGAAEGAAVDEGGAQPPKPMEILAEARPGAPAEVPATADQVRGADSSAAAAEAQHVARVAEVGEELVDVLNYLLAVANRLDIDVERAFVAKNTKNLMRTWESE